MNDPVWRERRREMTVGAFAFAIVLGLFCFSIFVTGDFFWKDRMDIVVKFKDIMGLKKGDNVVARGMVVGDVSKLEYDGRNGYVNVYCTLNQNMQILSDYSITVVPTSILGGRHMRISEGSKGAPVPPGTVLDSERPDDLVVDASAIVSSVRKALQEDGLLEDLRVTVRQAKEIVAKVNSGEGTLGKLISDEVVYNDLKASAASLKDISERLASGKGFLGKLMSEDEELYGDVRQTIQDVRAAVDDFRETSPVLTFTSVMFGAF